ncbi:TPA: IpaD/SipD/SspD family type III secretion system needle tip protein [Yersinia enterocolitica]|nr:MULTISPECIES: hypothetical protein [Yersinia]ATM88359.1 hypothetical protein CRN74_21240 [Yersinia frederiksenii]MCB5316982.1 IpaD/SipD/SspD family type III secretion system needle tip protein [Yersinia massiliensis]MDN0126106.1 IpaD/SipD/SspD family type III secretion system needle tip protein [Yersinia massiliensis]OWF71806.1 hypothetical protein B4902_16605 [Yersinia frederiksenii]QKJ10600.1 IpaD/SipD/SspD family type III secretion system needle tip protein [Yersinia massiliensis]
MTHSDGNQSAAMALQGMDTLILSQDKNDPYSAATLLLAQNQSLLPLSNSYTNGMNSSLSTNADDVQGQSRQLHRDLQRSSDNYNKMAKNFSSAAATNGTDGGFQFARLKRSTNSGVAAKPLGSEGTPPHIDALEGLINTIHGGYQKTYSEINQKAAEFMKDANTAIGKMSDFIKAGSDGKIHFRPKAFLEEMNKTFSKYTHFNAYGQGHYQNWSPNDNSTKLIHSFSGDDTALGFWKEKLGDGYIVKRGGDGKIEIFPNLTAIRQIYASVANSSANWEGGDMASQSFQSLQTAIDSQKNSVNSSVSQLLERFRQDNSTFETMIQLLTKMTEDLHRYNAGYLQ